MKKFFAFAAAAMMMFSASAETLNLYADATDYLGAVPFNSLWMDTEGYKSQVLYPAADLTAMVGKDIKSITFYTEEEGLTINGGLLNIALGETEEAALSRFVTEGMTQVGTCTFNSLEGQVVEYTITFDTPYRYNGGNLVFESVVATATSMASTYWTGKKVDYNSCVQGLGNANPQKFLPKTTFTFGEEGVDPQPQFTRGDVNDDQAINITDVTVLINYLLTSDATGVNLDAANCNQDVDGIINIADVTALVNFLITESWDM